MKILHCIWSMPTGGLEEMLIDIMKIQVESHEVHLAVVNHDYEPEMLRKVPAGVRLHLIERRQGTKNPWPLARLNLLALWLRPDAIHMHNREMASVLLPKTRWHKVLTVHALDLQLVDHRHTRRIAAISEAVRDDIARRYGIESTVIINGIDTDSIRVRPGREAGRPFRIVQVGRLDAQKKGQDVLIRAVATLQRRGYDVRATIIGDGADMESLRQLARAEGAEEAVEMAGRRDKAWVYEHLADYDLMVHPARWEGFGLVIAEAMAAQLPVAVTDEGGPYEVTDSGRLAVTFATDDVESCAQAIARAYDHYDELLPLAREARAYAAERYSIRRTAQEYERLYRTL